MNLTKISWKVENMTNFVLILVMFKFTVVSDCTGHVAVDFEYPRTYKSSQQKKILNQLKFNFTTYHSTEVSGNSFKVLCSKSDTVPRNKKNVIHVNCSV